MTRVSATTSRIPAHVMAAVACAIAAVVLFHFFGNATRGYVKTASLFWWWVSQWLDPNSETEHGWLVLGLAVWVMRRNLRMAEGGSRIADRPSRTAVPSASKIELAHPRDLDATPVNGPGWNPGSTIENPQFTIRSPQSIAPAVFVLLSGLALHAVGFVAQQSRVSIVALLLVAWGVFRLGGGRRWGNAAIFPLAFMVFAIPLSVLDEIGLPLRLWVTTAGEGIAHAAGIDVVRNGTQLVAPDGRFNYDVAAPCSGVRSLMALTALAALVGYLNFRSWSRRALVFALCLPLVYLGNVTRIVAIVFAAQAGGPAWGDRAHTVMGYGVFVIVLGGLLLLVAALQRWWPEPGAPSGPAATTRKDASRTVAAPVGAPATRVLPVVAALVIGVMVVEMVFLHRLAQLPARGEVGVVLAPDGLNPVELPAFLGTEWIGQRTDVTPVEREILPPDTGFSRKNYAFVADRSRDVFLSIVLSGRDRTSIHRPELCLVGQGWTIDGSVRQTFENPASGRGGSFHATMLRVRREIPTPRGKVIVPQLVAYWFVGGRTVVPTHWGRFVHDAWNRVTRARADRWAYVLLQTDARDGEAAALKRMQAVLDGTLPVFQRPLPAR